MTPTHILMWGVQLLTHRKMAFDKAEFNQSHFATFYSATFPKALRSSTRIQHRSSLSYNPCFSISFLQILPKLKLKNRKNQSKSGTRYLLKALKVSQRRPKHTPNAMLLPSTNVFLWCFENILERRSWTGGPQIQLLSFLRYLDIVQ